VKKAIFAIALTLALAGLAQAQNGNSAGAFSFAPNSLVVTRSVYVGTPSLLVPGVTVLPPGCPNPPDGNPVTVLQISPAGSYTPPIAVPCATPTADGTFPTVFQNGAADGHFGITSPIFLDNISTSGKLLGSLAIPTDQIVTSFSSKSELALHLSADGKSLTFAAYHGGPNFVTGPNIFDVSNGNTPGLIDPTNAAVGQYYRSVGEVDANGNLTVTDNNAYSGDNGRGAFKGLNGLYYMVGNDNSGNLSKPEVTNTFVGEDLVNSTGVELVYPGQSPVPVAPNINKIGKFSISQVGDPYNNYKPYKADKAGKDDNYRGITIYNNTLYVTKGSGGNGINTVYQVGGPGLPTGNQAALALVPITILPGFPITLAAGADPTTGQATPVSYPFGIWFADSSTLYVCDEGDGSLVTPAVNGNVATPWAQTTAGVQKWVLVNGVWQMSYVLNNNLKIGVVYYPDSYPKSIAPATGGCRNMTGQVNGDGTVTIYAITSTISLSGDQGADPNLLVSVTDVLANSTVPTGSMQPYGQLGRFSVVRKAAAGEVLRGVDFAPQAQN
jgi:hypothetical protein